MGRKKGVKNKIKPVIKPVIKTEGLPNLETTEGIKESFIENFDLNNDINDTNDTEISKPRLSKAERQAQILADKLNNLTDNDYKNYGEFAGVIFNLLSIRLGEKWRLNDEEKYIIGKPFARVATKYIGEFKYKDELALGLVLTGIIIPRIQNKNE